MNPELLRGKKWKKKKKKDEEDEDSVEDSESSVTMSTEREEIKSEGLEFINSMLT